MKKKIILLTILCFIFILIFYFLNSVDEKNYKNRKYIKQEVSKTIIGGAKIFINNAPSQYDLAIINMQYEMGLINSIENKEEWFLAYKEIIQKYQNILDPPETIYDYFSEEELNLLFGVVQAEIGDEWSFEQKANVANVIFNRLYSEERDFAKQNTLLEVLIPSQFCTVRTGIWKRVEVSDTTILACEYAFMFEDTTNGALFFDSNGALNYKFIFNDEAHNFYKIGDESEK